jgi:hypothetical protein
MPRPSGSASGPACCVVLFALALFVPLAARAQTADPPASELPPQGVLPDATFRAMFRKYTPPENAFSPFYSWDADMSLDLTIFREGRSAMNVSALFQTVGTTNLGSQVSVGGTGYFLGLEYVRTYSEAFSLSSGFVHFSSHLTRDLDDKIDEQRAKGEAIPLVDDPSEFNVIYVKGHWRLRNLPLAPEVEVVLQPINFRFAGGPADYVRPLYVGTRWRLWRGDRKSLTAETQQEIGENPFINIALVLAVYARNQQDGRVQVFVSGSPGGGVHVSPQTGALRDGIAFGVRLNLKG